MNGWVNKSTNEQNGWETFELLLVKRHIIHENREKIWGWDSKITGVTMMVGIIVFLCPLHISRASHSTLHRAGLSKYFLYEGMNE